MSESGAGVGGGSRRWKLIVAGLLGVALVYAVWRWSVASASAASDNPGDTMCVAAKLGLSCR